jgi:hypothetical protein
LKRIKTISNDKIELGTRILNKALDELEKMPGGQIANIKPDVSGVMEYKLRGVQKEIENYRQQFGDDQLTIKLTSIINKVLNGINTNSLSSYV